jgi:hypothetical protein
MGAIEWFWIVLIGLALQAALLALTALSSNYDDAAILRMAWVLAIINAAVFTRIGMPLPTSIGVAAVGPLLALVMCVITSPRGTFVSRGPFADFMLRHGVDNVISPPNLRRRRDGKPLNRMLCAERFEPDPPGGDPLSGEYIASTVVIKGQLYDVNLRDILGWLPREPWNLSLTDDEIGDITFAARPASPVAELLEGVDSGEFFVHEAFGERNLRGYLLAAAPELLNHPALRGPRTQDAPRAALWRAERSRAMTWALALVVATVLPVLFAWVALAGSVA